MAKNLLPPLITKITTDMQAVYENVSLAVDKEMPPMRVGVISDPAYAPPLTPEEKKKQDEQRKKDQKNDKPNG